MRNVLFVLSLSLILHPGFGQDYLNKEPIRTIAEVANNKNPASLSGRQVKLETAEIKKVFGRQVILVGDGSHRKAFLLVRLQESLKGLQAGTRLSIVGVLNQTPVQLHTWDVDDTVASSIRAHPVFVNVTEARMLKSPSSTANTNQPAKSR